MSIRPRYCDEKTPGSQTSAASHLEGAHANMSSCSEGDKRPSASLSYCAKRCSKNSTPSRVSSTTCDHNSYVVDLDRAPQVRHGGRRVSGTNIRLLNVAILTLVILCFRSAISCLKSTSTLQKKAATSSWMPL